VTCGANVRGLDTRRSTDEIAQIVSLELGGSNDIANLFPEKRDVSPGYKVKDKLENQLHDLVCDGTFTLRTVQRRIASDWQKLYKDAFSTPRLSSTAMASGLTPLVSSAPNSLVTQRALRVPRRCFSWKEVSSSLSTHGQS
jgi:hypothetical protein